MSHIEYTRKIRRDFPYYRRLWNKVVVILCAASFLPLVCIGGILYFYMVRSIKGQSLQESKIRVMYHKNSIDDFLTERIHDLHLVGADIGKVKGKSQEDLTRELAVFQGKFHYFEDLGLIDFQGGHLAYIGHYDLMDKNYQKALWFKAVMEKGVYISDVFQGFRKIPHFIIAVRWMQGNSGFIVRATVRSDLFDNMVSSLDGNTSGNVCLVNREGQLQAASKIENFPVVQGNISFLEEFSGIKIDESRQGFQLSAWMDNVPWLCMAWLPKKEIYRHARKIRNISFFIVILGVLIVIPVVLLVTDRLVSMLEAKKNQDHQLDTRLNRTVFLASAISLSKGVFSDMNTTLANIHVTAQLIEELAATGGSVQEFPVLAAQILSQVKDQKHKMERFLKFITPRDPMITEADLNVLVREVFDFAGSSLENLNIDVTLNLADSLPGVRTDSTLVRQAMIIILLNSSLVLFNRGAISIGTRIQGSGVVIEIQDNGASLEQMDLSTLFDTHRMSSRGDWGFGLAVCSFLLGKLGATLSGKNKKPNGVSFVMHFPVSFGAPISDGG